jgi:hypothetical protein
METPYAGQWCAHRLAHPKILQYQCYPVIGGALSVSAPLPHLYGQLSF